MHVVLSTNALQDM